MLFATYGIDVKLCDNLWILVKREIGFKLKITNTMINYWFSQKFKSLGTSEVI